MAKKREDDELVLSADRRRINITLATEVPGKTSRKVYLQQLDGVELSAWMNFSEERATYNKEGVQVGYSNYDGLFEYMIGLGLRDRGTDELIPEDEINDLPGSIKLTLYKKACELNGLRPEAASEEKKPLPRRSGSGTASSNGQETAPSTRPSEPTPDRSS